jgi:hypothetical protein
MAAKKSTTARKSTATKSAEPTLVAESLIVVFVILSLAFLAEIYWRYM